MQVGGDSPNTMPVAIQAGMAGHQIAKATIEPGTKFSVDVFKAAIKDPKALATRIGNGTMGNLPLSDALQQQGFIVRWAQKIPGIGPRITSWLGPSAGMNNLIGGLGKEALGGASRATVTKIALEGGDDVAKKLIAAGVSPATAKEVAAAAANRTAAAVVGGAGQNVAQSLATNVADDVAKQAMTYTLKQGAKEVSEEAVKAALANPTTAREALMKMGFYAKDATAMVKAAGAASAKGAATTVATNATATTAQKATGGIKGFFGKLLSGAKGNFVIAGVFSLATNAMQLAQGKMNLKQFVALTATDTLAYGAIGWGSAAAAGAIAQAIIPIPGAGFLIGLGLGLLGGMVYEKFLRNPIKNMLGGDPSAAAEQQAYDPAAGPQNPYGPGAAPPSNAPAYVAPTPGVDLSYDQVLAEIDRMAAGNR